MVEGGIEAGDLQRARKGGPSRANAGDVVRLVQRRQRLQGDQRRQRLVVDDGRPVEMRPAVHDAMADLRDPSARKFLGQERQQMGESRLLVAGLNPSLNAADAGIGFARPGNRFWPAALAAGVVTRDRDPLHALRVDRVGMTDQVKRATSAADALTADEYRDGLDRLDRLVEWLKPRAVCFVGLAGWRAASGHRKATAGQQPSTLGGRPVYVLPSTSGLNARSTPADLASHLRDALELADHG